MDGETLNLAAILAIILLVVSVFLGAFGLWQSFRLDEKTSEYSASLANLNSSLSLANSRIAELQAQVASGRSALSSANSKIASQEGEISRLGAELSSKNSEISRLSSELNASKELAQSTGAKLEDEQARLANLSGRFSLLRQEVNSSMSWFRENSAIPPNYSWESDIIPARIISSCSDGSQINLPCVSYIFQNTAIGIAYKNDIDNGSSDHLQSITETIRRRGGDCEDFALFFKAALNSVRSDGKRNLTSVKIGGGGSNFIVYPIKPAPDERYSYYPDSSTKTIGELNSSSLYVVCYARSSGAGHCAVAVSPQNITSSSDIPLLDGAEVFEPQDGRYLGKIGEEFSVCSSSRESCLARSGAIVIAISDSDLYSFIDGQWAGFSDFYSLLGEA